MNTIEESIRQFCIMIGLTDKSSNHCAQVFYLLLLLPEYLTVTG